MTAVPARYVGDEDGSRQNGEALLSACDLVRRCLGATSRGNTIYSVLGVGASPRWVVERRGRAAGPLAAGLYQPSSIRTYLGATGLGLVHRARPSLFSEIACDAELGLRPHLERVLGRSALSLSVLVPREDGRAPRLVLSILESGNPIAVAKVAASGSSSILSEVAALRALGNVELSSLHPPRLFASFAWQGLDVAIQEALVGRTRTSRALGEPELTALAELRERSADLLGHFHGDGEVVVHGDFSGWNTGRSRGQRLRAWDWEWARRGAPLEDWFHWQTQRLMEFGRGSPDAILRAALSPSRSERELFGRLGADTCDPASSLAASLRASIERGLSVAGGTPVTEQTLLDRLEGRAE